MTPKDTPSRDELPSIDILLIGHVTKDLLTPDVHGPYRLGGTVSFAAVTAARLGQQPTVITRAAVDTDLSDLRTVAQVKFIPSSTTTTFSNVYTPNGRIQYCFTPADAICPTDIPLEVRSPKSVLLGPIANEIHADVASLFASGTMIAAVPQGWMRRFHADGRVYHEPWATATSILPHLSLLILSLEDIDYDVSRLDPFFQYIPLVVLTEYRDGSTIYQRCDDGTIRKTHVSPRPALEVDPTGAGDVFATAFLIRMRETQDPVQSAWFANVVASFSIEQPGISGIPSRQQVLDYIAEHPYAPQQQVHHE